MAANIFVKPEIDFYYAGDTVKGVVYLSLMQPFMGANVKLKLKGWESCKWLTEHYIYEDPNKPRRVIPRHELLEKDDLILSGISSDTSEDDVRVRYGYIRKNNGHLYKIERHEGQHKFFQANQNLYSFNQGMMPAGQYAFPFAFQMSKEWPGTYSYKSPKAVARTKYELKVQCEMPGQKRSHLQHKIELFVYEQPTDVKSEMKSIHANIVACCCCNQGTADFKVYFNKNAYAYGDTAITWCELDNSSCKANCNAIEAILQHKLTMRDNQNGSHSFTHTVNNIAIGGVQSGQKFCGKDARKCDLKIESREPGFKNSIQPTSSGKIVNSQYFLTVTARMDICCECGGDITRLSIPILIYPSQKNIIAMPVQFTQAFQPQMMPVCNCVVGGMQVPTQPVRGGQLIQVQQPPGMENANQPLMQSQQMQQPMQSQMQQPMQQQMQQPMQQQMEQPMQQQMQQPMQSQIQQPVQQQMQQPMQQQMQQPMQQQMQQPMQQGYQQQQPMMQQPVMNQ